MQPTVYDLAHARITKGDWAIDPERGLLFGSRGAPFSALASGGYVYCRPCKDGRSALVHRLIWEHVHGPIPAGLEINHINGVKTDNRVANLEAVTHARNVMHAYETGLMDAPPAGSRTYTRTTTCPTHGRAFWRDRLSRGRHASYCRECRRLREAERRAAKRAA